MLKTSVEEIPREVAQMRGLERRFEVLKAGRRPYSRAVGIVINGGKRSVEARKVRSESLRHTSKTKLLLGIIDRYAALHKVVYSGSAVKLPPSMIDELERFVLRGKTTIHPLIMGEVASAINLHHERQAKLFKLAEEIRDRHKIAVLRVARRA